MRIIKLLFTVLFLALFAAVSLIGSVIVFDRRSRHIFLIKTTSFFSNMLLLVLDITVAPLYSPLWKKDTTYLAVSNHLTYLDILAIASEMPSVFVSSMEVRASAFLGIITRLGGTLFIERRNIFHLKQEIQMIANTLKEGFTVVIFPEGTSSNGDNVLPFKKSLMEAAVLSNIDVLPLCLMYSNRNGRLSGTHKDSVYWYGNMPFMSHFFNLLRHTDFDITLFVMEPLKTSEYESRSALSDAAYRSIETTYNWQKPFSKENAQINPADLSFELQ